MSVKKTIKKVMPNCIKRLINNMIHKHRTREMLKKHKEVKPFDNTRYPLGINLICDIKAETGLGQSARIIADILSESLVPFCIVQVDQPGDLARDITVWSNKIVDEPLYSVNLIHVNASEWARFYSNTEKSVFDYRYNIAYWLWELETFPKKWHSCIETVDEIWAPSEFICDCLRKYTRKPINKISYSIELPLEPVYDRNYFGLKGDIFYYLVMYDFKSVSDRKNPQAALESFIGAYSSDEANKNNIGLVLKVNHLEDGKELTNLKTKLKNYNNISLITENLTRNEVESLISNIDVLISLHKSEGFGLPVAEAMYSGVPTISTDWSATAEFVTKDNSCPVKFEYEIIKHNIGPYEKGNRWACADIGQASYYIRELYENKELYKQKSLCASKSIKDMFDAKKIATQIEERINIINKR